MTKRKQPQEPSSPDTVETQKKKKNKKTSKTKSKGDTSPPATPTNQFASIEQPITPKLNNCKHFVNEEHAKVQFGPDAQWVCSLTNTFSLLTNMCFDLGLVFRMQT